MTTWSCKALLAVLALTLLAACEPGQGNPFAGLGGPSAPLTQAEMAGGAITVKAPSGYCFDPRNLNRRFALMASCDVLTKANGSGRAPLSIITVSVSAASETGGLPTVEETATALSLTNISNRVRTDESILFRADGKAPAPGLSNRHWRGIGRVADQFVGFALYVPKDTQISPNRARAIMTVLIEGASPPS